MTRVRDESLIKAITLVEWLAFAASANVTNVKADTFEKNHAWPVFVVLICKKYKLFSVFLG